MIYYTSDIHLDDQKIFDKCNRPFCGLEEYKNEIIRRWNNKVNDGDTVYILGDIVEDTSVESIETFRLLNGIKHLIIGNHDLKLLDRIRKSNIFETIDFMSLIEDDGRKVCICHYPVMDWMEFNRNGIHVYGHIHNKTVENGKAYAEIKQYYSDKPAYNCGVDVTDYEPVTLNEMIKLKELNKNGPYIN